VRSPLTPDRWTKVEKLFMEAAELPPEERSRFVITECGGDEQILDEVLSLLRYDTREPWVLDALQSGAGSLLTEVSPEGTMLGPWRVERELGRGGMSVVYLAARADGQFAKRVAIKLIKRGMDTSAVVDRLRRERRILGALEHSSIARLLDGGTTPDGLPYIVMEYVEGLPIDEWCESQALGVEQRCELIGRVGDAVAYAHRSLVIHRDLKPGNILVGADGNPKLLDFGIAKVLGGEPDGMGGPETRGPMRLLTPEYASPEQLAGGAVGTATDVYSLGVVLFELLTGQRPGPQPDKASSAALRSGKGQRWSRRIRGDLDNILQMALRTDPERRYLSVGLLQADLRLHLSGMPVAAREETVLYRSGKFVRRHRAGVLAAALVVLSLVAGMASTLWQAHRTEVQRQLAEKRRVDAEREAVRLAAAERRAEGEHAEADSQRALAERRFTEVRELASKFMFDFHDAIAPLPGTIPARKMVVETGIRYYDSLVKDAGGNRELLEEIARGYDRLGDVQGNPFKANLGDFAGAAESYRKALAVRDKVTDPSADFLRDRVSAAVRRGQLPLIKGDLKTAQRELEEAIRLGTNSPQAGTYEVREAVANAWSALGDVKMRVGVFIDCIPPYTKVLDIWTDLARRKRDPPSERSGISLAHTKLGDAWSRMGRTREALENLSIAVGIDKQLLADSPNSPGRLRKLYIDYLIMGLVFRSAGPEVTLDSTYDGDTILQSAVEIADRMAASDPDNSARLVDVLTAHSMLGEWLRKRKDLEGALLHDRRALAAAERNLAAAGPGLDPQEALLQCRLRMGEVLAESGKFDDAMDYFNKAGESLEAMEKQNPGIARVEERRGELAGSKAVAYDRFKKWGLAIETFHTAIAVEEVRRKREPDDVIVRRELADYYGKQAGDYAAVGQPAAAAKAMQSALDALGEIETKRSLTAEEEQIRRDDLAALEGWRQR
jgi:tetratricopeptide (TPR) repeat protein/predicted Ser/Thr protein kinase